MDYSYNFAPTNEVLLREFEKPKIFLCAARDVRTGELRSVDCIPTPARAAGPELMYPPRAAHCMPVIPLY